MSGECPNDELLVQMLDGKLPADQLQRLHEHVDACRACSELLRELGHVAEPTMPVGGADLAPWTAAQPSGKLGRYAVLGMLGKGGMGTVYVAFDPDLDRKVALKVLHVGSDRAQKRLLREARAMAQLSHPNVVPVHEVGTFDGGRFVAMELIEGGTLGAWASGRGWREVLRACIEAGRGLQSAHEAGLIHRDFKPANVLCDASGRARVTDFGLVLARASAETTTADVEDRDTRSRSDALTQTGWAVGTPAYMAPEQAASASADEQSDQFSFCVTTWQTLSGSHPWDGGRTRTPPPRWSIDAPKVPRRVVEALERGLSVAPEERWPSMAALLGELESASAPTRTGLRVVVGLTVVGSVGLAAALVSSRPSAETPCADSAQYLTGVWDGKRRSEVRDALLATGVTNGDEISARVETVLDEYGEAWTQAHRRACLSTLRGEQSPALLDQKMACLQTRIAGLDALVDVLVEADPSVASRAVFASRALSPLDRCEDAAALGDSAWTPQPQQVASVARTQDHVSRAFALQSAGRYAEGLVEARSAVRIAEDLEGSPIRDEAQYREGKLLDSVGEHQAAAEVLQEAALRSGRNGHDETAAKASTMLVHVLGGRLAQLEEAATWGLHADVAIDRAGLGQSWKARLHTNLGVAYNFAGKFDKASAELERAISLASGEGGDDDGLTYLAAIAEMANLHQSRGHHDEALQLYRRAAELAADANGPGHPMLGTQFDNMGNSLRALGRFEEARSYHERALEIFADQGTDHPVYRAALSNLGGTLLVSGQLDEAIEVFERAAKSPTGRGDDINTAVAYVNMAGALAGAERFDEAVTYAQRGLKVLEQRLEPGHPFVAGALINLGLSHLAAGNPRAARAPLRRALEAAEGQEFPPGDLASAQFGLARALGLSPEALSLARDAAAAFAELGRVDDVAEVEAFLAD